MIKENEEKVKYLTQLEMKKVFKNQDLLLHPILLTSKVLLK